MLTGSGFQIINTALETDGRPSLQPFPTASRSPVTLSTDSTPSNSPIISAKAVLTSKSNWTGRYHGRRAAEQAMIDQTEVFQPIATGPPPRSIPSRDDHPAPRLNIVRP